MKRKALEPDDVEHPLEPDLAKLGRLLDQVFAQAQDEDGRVDARLLARLQGLLRQKERLVAATGAAMPPRATSARREELPRISQRETLFVEAFCGEAQGKAARAARAAGYAASDAKNQGYRLLRKPAVLAHIAARNAGDPLVATRVERQRFWTSIVRGEPVKVTTLLGVIEGPPPVRDRVLASQLLAKAQGDFVEARDDDDHGHVVQLPSNGRELLAEDDEEPVRFVDGKPMLEEAEGDA